MHVGQRLIDEGLPTETSKHSQVYQMYKLRPVPNTALNSTNAMFTYSPMPTFVQISYSRHLLSKF